jgi:hypothetical protein
MHTLNLPHRKRPAASDATGAFGPDGGTTASASGPVIVLLLLLLVVVVVVVKAHNPLIQI